MTCQMAVLVNEGESEEAKSPLERAQRNTADVTHRSFLSAHAHALAISDNISPIQISAMIIAITMVSSLL